MTIAIQVRRQVDDQIWKIRSEPLVRRQRDIERAGALAVTGRSKRTAEYDAERRAASRLMHGLHEDVVVAVAVHIRNKAAFLHAARRVERIDNGARR